MARALELHPIQFPPRNGPAHGPKLPLHTVLADHDALHHRPHQRDDRPDDEQPGRYSDDSSMLVPRAPVPNYRHRYGYVEQNPTAAIDPSGLVLLYIGGSVVGYPGVIGASPLGLGGVWAWGAGFNWGVAYTTGVYFQARAITSPPLLGIPFQVEVNGEVGVYWGKYSKEGGYTDYVSVCDYGGPFATLTAGGGDFILGIGLAWSVDEKVEAAFHSGDPAAMLGALGYPVGMVLSAGWSLIPAVSVTASVTKSKILYSSAPEFSRG